MTSELPWPLDSGGHLRSFHLLRSLASEFDVKLITPAADGAAIEAVERAGILVRAVAPPSRHWFREGRWALAAAAVQEPYVLYRRHYHREMVVALAEEVRAADPDLVYLDHLDSAAFLAECRDAASVVDLHNVYSALLRRTADESGRGPLRWYLRREAALLADMERRVARRATGLLASSREDCEYFAAAGADAVTLVPNGVDCGAYRDLPVGRQDGPPLLMYVGTMSWEPNAKAAVFLAETVLPAVRREFPDCCLRIVGRDPGPEVTALRALPGVDVTGRVPEMSSHLAAAHVLAVPLESGGGTRLKILEAFAAGLPVVSTPVGCEGIEARTHDHLLIAERPDFAAGVCEVLRQPARAAAMASRARALALHRYDWSSVGAIACRAVADAIERRWGTSEPSVTSVA